MPPTGFSASSSVRLVDSVSASRGSVSNLVVVWFSAICWICTSGSLMGSEVGGFGVCVSISIVVWSGQDNRYEKWFWTDTESLITMFEVENFHAGLDNSYIKISRNNSYQQRRKTLIYRFLGLSDLRKKGRFFSSGKQKNKECNNDLLDNTTTHTWYIEHCKTGFRL